MKNSGTMGKAVVTATAWVAAMVWVQSLAQEFPHAAAVAREKKGAGGHSPFL